MRTAFTWDTPSLRATLKMWAGTPALSAPHTGIASTFQMATKSTEIFSRISVRVRTKSSASTEYNTMTRTFGSTSLTQGPNRPCRVMCTTNVKHAYTMEVGVCWAPKAWPCQGNINQMQTWLPISQPSTLRVSNPTIHTLSSVRKPRAALHS